MSNSKTRRRRDERPEIPMERLRLPDQSDPFVITELQELADRLKTLETAPGRLLNCEVTNIRRLFATLLHYQRLIVVMGEDPDFNLPLRVSRNGIAYLFERRCRECGCTDHDACPGGCYWVEQDLCSQCQGKAKRSTTESQRARRRRATP